MFENGEQLIPPIAAVAALLLSLLLFVAGARLLIRPFRWAGQHMKAATGLGASACGLALLVALYFEPGPFYFAVILFVFAVRFIVYLLPLALISLAQQLPQACDVGRSGSACAEPILTVTLQLWGRAQPPVASTQSGLIQRLNSVSDAVQFITSPPPSLGLPGSLISVLLIVSAIMAVLWLLPRAIEQAHHMDWHSRSILLFYKSSALAVSLIFALYLSLTAIVAIPVFNDRTDRISEGNERLNKELPALLQLYSKSLTSTVASSEDEPPDTVGLHDEVRHLWDSGPQGQTGAKSADASGPITAESVQAKAPQDQATREVPVSIRALLTSELEGKIAEIDRQVTEFTESKQNLEKTTKEFQQNGQLFLETVTEYFDQQNTGHVGGRLTLQHATLLVGQYGSWLGEYTTSMSRCDGQIARVKNDIFSRVAKIRQELTRLKPLLHPGTDALFYLPNPLHSPNCYNIVPDYGDFLLPRQSPAASLALFGRATSWLLLTESRDLALIVGLLGFGFFGALATSFIRQVSSSTPLADTALIVPALVRGVAAAILIFLAVVGGLAVFTRSDPEPNAYAVFLACFIAAVFSEDVWEWAQRRQRQQLAKGGEQGQVNPGQTNPAASQQAPA